ncbi:MAG: hypothetical protein K9M98_00960 [Cephaloticoccus sp.]|nr:hypothetical protein [Cephaloticoccus sp.]MCF7759048.1 hypothetical protein [Cephaloticoccus sp.]
MRPASPLTPSPLTAFAIILAGVGVALLAWLLPVNLKSLSPALLRAAGAGTPSVAALGQQLVATEKIGPAQLVLAAARTVGDREAAALGDGVQQLAREQGGLVAWGGWDPFLEPIFKLHEAHAATSTPVLDFFIPAQARTALLGYLQNSRSQGVQAVLKTRSVTDTGRFVPALQPGGQPLDAVILLTALLYQGEHLSPSLQRELRSLSEAASSHQTLGELEEVYLDLLSLAQRLDWVQMGELLRRTDDAKTMSEYAHLARVAPGQLPVIYTAALFSDSADRVANYLIKYGKPGAEDLRTALACGQGAVRQLMLRQVPVNRGRVPGMGELAGVALLHPRLMLAVKYLGYLVGAFLVFRGLERYFFPRPEIRDPALPRMQSGVLALVAAALIIVATEPFLLNAAPISEYRFKIVIPLLANSAVPPPVEPNSIHAMNPSTIVSIGIFALLQVGIYLICLRKLREIQWQHLSPQLKLRLVENEDNLFDSGLYVGMMGTAAALVLQVMGVIDHNLLAAYASNLFGLVCVALVKIRHVRGFKRRLIMEAQSVGAQAS